MNKKISAVVTLVGLILIMCAMAVLFHNKKEDNLAQKSSNTVLSSLKEKIEESNLKTSEEKKDLNKDLNQYDGYIKIPKLNLELPVMKKTTQANLKKSPCIYSGTAKDSNLIIAAHNYSAHFGKINQLENGDKVQYTDLQNNTYNYCVTAKEKINGSNSEQMQNENYALTLFTCDYTGRDRIAKVEMRNVGDKWDEEM